MSEVKKRVPAVEGWFTMDEEQPRLLGSRCKSCGTYFFPKESFFCKNPHCNGAEFDEVPLSRVGKLWSFTNNCYAAPAPFMAPDPFVPYAIAAVELAEEKMVVLGQMVAGTEVSDLKAGMDVELVLEKLYEDDASEYMVWKWKPVAA
jgi:uncharacterized OB-fold protein